jgi:hypothetical protein
VVWATIEEATPPWPRGIADQRRDLGDDRACNHFRFLPPVPMRLLGVLDNAFLTRISRARPRSLECGAAGLEDASDTTRHVPQARHDPQIRMDPLLARA